MIYQNLFSGNIKKNVSNCRLLKILSSLLYIKSFSKCGKSPQEMSQAEMSESNASITSIPVLVPGLE